MELCVNMQYLIIGNVVEMKIADESAHLDLIQVNEEMKAHLSAR